MIIGLRIGDRQRGIQSAGDGKGEHVWAKSRGGAMVSGKVGRAILVFRSLGRKMRRVWANEEEEQKEDIWLAVTGGTGVAF